MMTFPRGVEVLVKKAAVDAAFRDALLQKKSRAAELIGLALSAEEAALLDATPAPQLAAIIAQTEVPPKQRAAFRGYVAAAMLAALGVGAADCIPVAGGARPDVPPPDTSGPASAATAATATTVEEAGGNHEGGQLGGGAGGGHTEGKGGMRPDLPGRK